MRRADFAPHRRSFGVGCFEFGFSARPKHDITSKKAAGRIAPKFPLPSYKQFQIPAAQKSRNVSMPVALLHSESGAGPARPSTAAGHPGFEIPMLRAAAQRPWPGDMARKVDREKMRRDIAQPATGLKRKARFCFKRDQLSVDVKVVFALGSRGQIGTRGKYAKSAGDP